MKSTKNFTRNKSSFILKGKEAYSISVTCLFFFLSTWLKFYFTQIKAKG